MTESLIVNLTLEDAASWHTEEETEAEWPLLPAEEIAEEFARGDRNDREHRPVRRSLRLHAENQNMPKTMTGAGEDYKTIN